MTVRFFLFLNLFLGSTLASFGQDSEDNFAWGISLKPNYSTHLLFSNSNSSDESLLEYSRDTQFGIAAIGGNAFVKFSLGERSAISAGLGYMNHGVQSKWLDLTFSEPDAQYPYTRVKYKSRFHNIEVPLKFHYSVSDRIDVFGGVSMLYLFGMQDEFIYGDADGIVDQQENVISNEFIEFYNRLNYSAILGADFEVANFGSSSFRAGGYGQFAIRDMLENGIYSRHSLSLGAELSFLF